MANAELYLTFAHLFRRFRLELEGYNAEEDMRMLDFFSISYQGIQILMNY